jgi:hypothetical protein
MKSHGFGVALLSAAVIAASAPAQAQHGTLTRSFVSSSGVDTNPCTITQPCASFAHAYTMVGANGIVAALDPGKYGPLTISGPVTINGNGWAAITAAAQNTGITINAGSGDVILTGLEVDGAGAAYAGIVFNSGSSLTITNCSLQNFVGGGTGQGAGIYIAPTAGTLDFSITNTTVSHNVSYGISFQPSESNVANGVIDHVVANNNANGIQIDTSAESGANGTTVVTISNSIVSYSTNFGIYADNFAAELTVSIDNTSVSSIPGAGSGGIEASSTANVFLGRSVITGNDYGVIDVTSGNTFYSFGDNRISGNTHNGSLTTTLSTR